MPTKMKRGGRGLGTKLCVFYVPALMYARYHAHLHVPQPFAFVFEYVLINLLQFLSLQFHSHDTEPEQYTHYSPGHYSIYGDEDEGPVLKGQEEEEEEEVRASVVNSPCFLV